MLKVKLRPNAIKQPKVDMPMASRSSVPKLELHPMAGWLWGIIKQGYKCKDCGANCHKQCRDLLVLACRKFSRGTSVGSNHGSLPSSPSLPPDLEAEYLDKTIPPSLSVQDEVFEFPSVAAEHQDLDGRAITLVTGSSRKISVRLQRVTTSQATQTEPLWHEPGWNDSGSHTFPKMKSKFYGKAGKNKGFAKWENENPSMQDDVELEAEAPQDIQDHNGIETLPETQESEHVNAYFLLLAGQLIAHPEAQKAKDDNYSKC
ncbi:hypothetical protein EK904_006758 [Melospiza melodia maxima]|nr:hypothetical protein EK904_006758 [Melospiza melodia maxima]